MTLPKKGSRSITVSSIRYRWMVTGNDDFINVVIEREKLLGQKLVSMFDYHNEERIGGGFTQRGQITSVTIRKLIEFGITNGWDPDAKGERNFKIDGESAVSWKS